MGTSKSSSGSPSKVPLVPPWVPDVEVQENETDTDQTPVPEVAPPRRFASTRLALGEFGKSGSRDALARGIGRYISAGLGGSVTATRRFGGTAATAAALYEALGGAEAQAALDREVLGARTPRQLIDAVIEVARPVDGSQDSEASRASINDAVSELLGRYPDANLFELTEPQREYVVECFVSLDVYRRFVLDVGGAIREKAPSASTGLARLRQARDYIRENVVAAFDRLRESGTRLRGSHVSQIVAQALKDAFDVFSGFSE